MRLFFSFSFSNQIKLVVKTVSLFSQSTDSKMSSLTFLGGGVYHRTTI